MGIPLIPLSNYVYYKVLFKYCPIGYTSFIDLGVILLGRLLTVTFPIKYELKIIHRYCKYFISLMIDKIAEPKY